MQNIFKNLTKLHTPEWLKIVNPAGLVDLVLSCLKFLINSLDTYRKEPFRYNHSIQRKGYSLISWTAQDIQDTSNKHIAGNANTFALDFPFRVCNVPEFEILGCGYTDNIAIKNIDYIYKNNCYWFREDPSKFCYTYTDKDNTMYYTVAFCSTYTKLPKIFKAPSEIESTPKRVQMYDNLISNGLSGISNSLYLDKKGIITNNGLHGTVITKWQEQDYIFAITSTGNFITIPKNLDVTVELGKPIILNYNINF